MKKVNNLGSPHAEIVEWIKNLKFKKKLFGGVSEEDVWLKISELNSLYESALISERAKYQALLEKRTGGDNDDAG